MGKRSPEAIQRRKMKVRWNHMRLRVTDPLYKDYHNYGGRGITICDRWLDFNTYYSDVGDPPFYGAQLDRIDNSGPYSPDNCHWVTARQNSRNTRVNVIVSLYGEQRPLCEWAEILDIPYPVIKYRNKKGIPLDGIFSEDSKDLRNNGIDCAAWRKAMEISNCYTEFITPRLFSKRGLQWVFRINSGKAARYRSLGKWVDGEDFWSFCYRVFQL